MRRLSTLMVLGVLFIQTSLTGLAHAAAGSSPMLFPPLQMGAVSQEIPPGARVKIKLVTAVDSQTALEGQPFVAITSEDLWAQDQLILPRGTAVRGRVEAVKKARYLSKGGLLRLNFDHVTLPSGELRSLALSVDAGSAKMDAARNALYTDPGVSAKLNTSVDKGVAQYKDMHDKGVAAGKARGGGLNMLLTVPTTTLAGVATGTAITTVEATKAVFGKGEIVTLNPGDELLLDFSKGAVLQGQ